MHDTFLLEKISKELNTICLENKIDKVQYLKIIVNSKSHVNDKNLTEHLMTHNKEFITQDFTLDIIKDNIEEQTAIIDTIQGEKIGN